MIKSFVFIAMCCFAMNAVAFDIVAHRGASSDAPENTLAAANLAWEVGAESIEFDIWRTKDGHLVVCHDLDTYRTTGVRGKINEMTLEEVQQLDAGSWKDPKFAGERIPTVDEFVATNPNKKFFFEIKTSEDISKELAESIKKANLRDEQICIFSFNYFQMRTIKKNFPDASVYLAIDAYRPERSNHKDIELLIQQAKAAGIDGFVMNLTWPIDKEFVDRLHAENLKLYVWTIHHMDHARRFKNAGADGILVDKVAWFINEVGEN